MHIIEVLLICPMSFLPKLFWWVFNCKFVFQKNLVKKHVECVSGIVQKQGLYRDRMVKVFEFTAIEI